MWRLNPRGHQGLLRLGAWAPLLLGVVCLACAASAYGFFRGRRWGYRLGIALLLVNLAGDLVNAALGIEPRAVVGVPIVALLLWYLFSSRVRAFFSSVWGKGWILPGVDLDDSTSLLDLMEREDDPP